MYNVYIKVQAKPCFHPALQDVFWHHKDELDLDYTGLDGTDMTVLASVIAHSLKPVSINNNFNDFVGDIFCFHLQFLIGPHMSCRFYVCVNKGTSEKLLGLSSVDEKTLANVNLRKL